MEVNWIIIGMVMAGVAILVYFLIKRNKKDQEDYEHYLEENNAVSEEKERDDL